MKVRTNKVHLRMARGYADVEKITKSKPLIGFYHQGSEWNSIRQDFWANSRDDFLVETLTKDYFFNA